MSHLPDVPSWIVSLLAGVAGVGVTWGYLKATMDIMKKTIDENVKDIRMLKDRGLNLVFVPECDKIRAECHQVQGQRVSELKEAIMDNRNMVIEKFDEVTRFMGYVTRALENGKKDK